MADGLVDSIIPVLFGVALAFLVTFAQNFWIQRSLRKKYSRVFSFELLQLKRTLDRAISRYYVYQMNREGLSDDIGRDDIEGIPLYFPNDALQYEYFKSKISFLNENFEKLSIFKEDTITSIIKIHSLLEEYDTLSKGSERIFLVGNLEQIQKEIQMAIGHLKREEERRC